MQVIQVESDYEHLRVAFAELLEEFYRADVGSNFEEAVANAANADALREAAVSRSLSPGYYCWAQYLFYLDRFRVAGVQFTFHDLAEEDLLGLAIVTEERRKFYESHPACPVCRTLNESSSFSCRDCGRNLMEQGA
jgi:hypothetical protein